MLGIGSGYDLSVGTFSPDGKVFQIEYAKKCISNESLVLGIICNDGIVLGAERWFSTKLALPDSRTRVFKISNHISAAIAGLRSDGLNIVDYARKEASKYEETYGVPIPGCTLADRVGLYVHNYTSVWSYRPLGASILLATAEKIKPTSYPGSKLARATIGVYTNNFEAARTDVDLDSSAEDFSLWLIDPSGAAYKYRGTAQGKASSGAKTELEKLNLNALTIDESIKSLSKIIVKQHNEVVPDKLYNFEFITINSVGHIQKTSVEENQKLQKIYEQEL